MRYLPMTVTAVLCALMLHHTTGAAHRLTEDEQLVLAKLKLLRGQLKSGPVGVQAPKAGEPYASHDCYFCASETVDGVLKLGNASCDDPFPDPPKVTLVPCGTDGDFCGKALLIDSSNGITTRITARGCVKALENTKARCSNGEIRLTGTATMDGKSGSITIVDNCCNTDKCNGAPSISYTSKIFVSVIGLLVIFFYPY